MAKKREKPEATLERLPITSPLQRPMGEAAQGQGSYYFGVWADPQSRPRQIHSSMAVHHRRARADARSDARWSDDQGSPAICFWKRKIASSTRARSASAHGEITNDRVPSLIDFFKENRRVDDLRPADFARLRTSMYRVGWAAEINPRPSPLAEPYVRVRIRLLFQVISEIRGSTERGPTCLE